MIGFVRASATSAGMVNAKIPENGRAEKGSITQDLTPAPSIRRPRITIRNSDRCQDGAVNIYRAELAEFDITVLGHQVLPPGIISRRSGNDTILLTVQVIGRE